VTSSVADLVTVGKASALLREQGPPTRGRCCSITTSATRLSRHRRQRTHYRLTNPDGSSGADVEIITWLDDSSRYALHITAHVRVTGPIVLGTFRATLTQLQISRRSGRHLAVGPTDAPRQTLTVTWRNVAGTAVRSGSGLVF
jgi:hypothetical protein